MYNDGGIFIVFGFLIILRSYISLMFIYEYSLPSYSTSYVPLTVFSYSTKRTGTSFFFGQVIRN